MVAEPILAFFFIFYVRKILRRRSALPEWDKPLRLAMFAVVSLFILQFVLSLESVAIWIWHAIMLLFIAITYKRRELYFARNIIIAFLPVIIVSILTDIAKLLPDRSYTTIRGYLEFAFPFSVIWMIVMLIIFNRQRKALAKEHKKVQEEEEQKRIMAARKAELEIMVAERTSEIMQQKNELEQALTELRNTQSQLIQAEKMASLGALTAGIAHEIQNPLNFVNNFSEVNSELIDELKAELATGNVQHATQIAGSIKDNEQKINHHGKRADAIVKGMLLHSRTTSGQKELTDVNALVDEYLRLAYHGLRAKDKSFNAKFETDFDNTMEKINIVPEDIGRAILNLVNNAFYTVTEKKKETGDRYEPTVFVGTRKLNDRVEITVKDNGKGIPQQVLDKIFQPFFTTKPPGQGTGLGLSLAYDIIKAHSGELRVETKEARPDDPVGRGAGSSFIIELPSH